MNINNIINRIKSINSNIKFVGQFDENNLKTGYWEVYWRNGKLWYKGNYINGNKEGYWVYYWDNGNIRFKGHYKNGKIYEI